MMDQASTLSQSEWEGRHGGAPRTALRRRRNHQPSYRYGPAERTRDTLHYKQGRAMPFFLAFLDKADAKVVLDL